MTRLKEIRLERGYKKKDINQILGIYRASLKKWEEGEAFPPVKNLAQLALLYKTSIEYLLGITDINIPTTTDEIKLRSELLSGITKTELEKIGIKSDFNILMKGWTSGEYYPRLQTCLKLSNYFNVTVDYLLGLCDYPSWDQCGQCASDNFGKPVYIKADENDLPFLNADAYGLLSLDGNNIYLANGNMVSERVVTYSVVKIPKEDSKE